MAHPFGCEELQKDSISAKSETMATLPKEEVPKKAKGGKRRSNSSANNRAQGPPTPTSLDRDSESWKGGRWNNC